MNRDQWYQLFVRNAICETQMRTITERLAPEPGTEEQLEQVYEMLERLVLCCAVVASAIDYQREARSARTSAEFEQTAARIEGELREMEEKGGRA